MEPVLGEGLVLSTASRSAFANGTLSIFWRGLAPLPRLHGQQHSVFAAIQRKSRDLYGGSGAKVRKSSATFLARKILSISTSPRFLSKLLTTALL